MMRLPLQLRIYKRLAGTGTLMFPNLRAPVTPLTARLANVLTLDSNSEQRKNAELNA